MLPHHRITSLERWGFRDRRDFQPAGLQAIKAAGFTGVFVNGGSGIGPDMVSPESMVTTESLPDLMPLTARSNQALMEKQARELAAAGLVPWLNIWGIPGPDHSVGGDAESNRFFDRRTKLEMGACRERHPELFGSRHLNALSWRGSHPLCVSHVDVQKFYDELITRLLKTYDTLGGIFFFPGDADPELCDDSCPRCATSGRTAWSLCVEHVNRLYAAAQAVRPGLPFYFAVWNQDHPRGKENIRGFLDQLAPGIGVCMSLSDHVVQQRRSGPVRFNQPWSIMGEAGDLFQWVAGECERQTRPVMVLGEISQSEVWDPVCHNFPLPGRTLDFLRTATAIPAINALHDFWGHRSPFLPHANHAAMAAFLEAPGEQRDVLLARAAASHYELPVDEPVLSAALEAWHHIETVVDAWALVGWSQRFSFAIGRDAARGRFYQALVPAYLRSLHKQWGLSLVLRNGDMPAGEFLRLQLEDRIRFLGVADIFSKLAVRLRECGHSNAANLVDRESANIALAGELIASVGRTVAAHDAFGRAAWDELRTLVEEEIDARERELEISGRIGFGGGVNTILVEEDIQNMRLFLSHPSFPLVPDDRFHFTATPYTV